MEPDRSYDGAERLDRSAVRPPGHGLTVEALRALVEPRLDGARRVHVAAVAETIERVAQAWSAQDREATLRAAWPHDAWRTESPEAATAVIRAAGEEPDPWAVRHAPVLLHAQAAAAWGRADAGERDPRVLLAVRHHPTGHADWGELGRALYVADFCEPGRSFAASVGAERLVERAAEGLPGLTAVAAEVLALRLARSIRRAQPIHPDSWRAWNAWAGAPEPS
jgi:HD superfamily phosphohydrolase YqeK